eukprot:GHVS01056186.1.p1 GENE.GHVS01056186.1~~GHVS01056186.1.p1  ORF type:complete len:774 (-),score=91.30 GHVS01056186.1:294-2615(-)
MAGRFFSFSCVMLALLSFCNCQDRRSFKDVSNTILVTYKEDCLQESMRVSLVGRSVEEVVQKNVSRSASSVGSLWEVPTVKRSSLDENHLSVSSTFSITMDGAKEEEAGGGCRVREQWLKHIGLQLISLEGECERVGKEDLLERLSEEDCVLSREVDTIRYPSVDESEGQAPPQYVPNDPQRPSQWHLDDNNVFSVQARAAWAITKGGSGSAEEQPGNTVGIVDFGFLQSHPDLKANWFSNREENCEANGVNGIDEDADGFMDDCHGWNMDRNSNDLNGYSHGTKVAGCLGAVTDNDVGISGTCPNCRMLPTTVGGSVSSELVGVNYIISKGVRIVNLSLGGGRSSAEYNTFKRNPDVLFVVAAGNESCNLDLIDDETNPVPCVDKYGSKAGYPASLSSELLNVLSVGAITKDGGISSFSSTGAKRVQVFAPGSRIYTTSISGGNPIYSSRSGTSYACPIAAGVAGLVLQMYPSLSACQLREVLIRGCTANTALEGKAVCNGQLSAYQALKEGELLASDLSAYNCEERSGSEGYAQALDRRKKDVRSVDQGAAAVVAGVTKANPAVALPFDGVVQKSGQGEFFLEAMVAAITKSGIIVNAGLLEVTVSLLLSLFSNVVDPFALVTEGVPMRQYLRNMEKKLSGQPAYGSLGGLSVGPISLLLSPLSNAKDFLSSKQIQPQKAPQNGSFPLDFGFGMNVIEPLVFGKMMAMQLLSLNGDSSKPSSVGGWPDILADPLQLWVVKKQLKQLIDPLEATDDGEKVVFQKLKPLAILT